MCERLSNLRCKEVINVSDGSRLGYVSDVELERETGRVVALIVPCPGRFFGLLGSKEAYVIPWHKVCRIGDDIILVDVVLREVCRPREKIKLKW
jgi:YlmC/YmxH family sporulation protein